MPPGPSLRRERLAWAERRLLVGVDEAGRGPLAGPVVAAAVVFPENFRVIRGVADSKTVTLERRESLAVKIRSRAICFGVGAASCREIDRVNIRVATAVAMRRAVTALLRRLTVAGSVPSSPDGSAAPAYVILVDGLPFPELGYPHEALVDGDALCYSVAAASIVAKTVRDRLMRGLHVRHPGYGWDSNVGYGTPEHLAGLASAGPTRHHRLTFAPLAQHDLFQELGA
ncbi:MAG TPA: ribonuclease HII [Gemmatimonadales bacterium]|nr:ribonuclease HII [Gemmatimonadales bacterium]